MDRTKRLYITGAIFCVVTAGYALLPVFFPQMISLLGIPLSDGGLSLFIACALTAFLFVVAGLMVCHTAGDMTSVHDMVYFLYAAAFCILGKCKGYDADGMLTAILTVVADFMVCFSLFFGIRMICTFSFLSNPEKGREKRGKYVFIPFIYIAVKYLLVLTGIITINNFPMEFAGTLLFWLFFISLAGLLSYFLKKMPRQASLAMRTIFYSVCIAFLPFLCHLAVRAITGFSTDLRVYWTPVSTLSLLTIPAGFVCAAFQMIKDSSDSISPKIMSGCSTLILVLCVLTFYPAIMDHLTLLLVGCSLIYQILAVPLRKFLNPKLTAVERSLDSLERTAFRCSDSERILVVVADWLTSMLRLQFVAFYQKKGHSEKNGEFLYIAPDLQDPDRKTLDSMLAERLSSPQLDEQRMIHRKQGFSVPMFNMHEFSGFVFIGARSEDEMFSESEMALLTPVSRILMESMMVLDLRKQADYVSQMQNQIVFSFADMIESRDGTTGQHIKRTSTIVSLLANNLREHNLYADKLMPADYEMIALAAPLHDIGKIKVPDSILSKPGKLTDEEFDTIKTHPVEGEKIINRTMSHIENERYLKLAREMALYHHEKWNGKGYPEGLSGEDIPVSARIMAIADVFDALCSSRSYKEAFSVSKAFSILEESRGSHFEPCLVDEMKLLRPELEKIYVGT